MYLLIKEKRLGRKALRFLHLTLRNILFYVLFHSLLRHGFETLQISEWLQKNYNLCCKSFHYSSLFCMFINILAAQLSD